MTVEDNLTADRAVALGTPSTLTPSTTNATTADSHTHAVTFPASQAPLNRTVGSNDNATGTVTDTGGNLSVPVAVTVAAGTASNTLPGTGLLSLRSWLATARNALAWLVGRFGPDGVLHVANGGTGATSAAAARTSLGAAPAGHVAARGTAQHALAGGTDATSGFSQANFTQAEKDKLDGLPDVIEFSWGGAVSRIAGLGVFQALNVMLADAGYPQIIAQTGHELTMQRVPDNMSLSPNVPLSMHSFSGSAQGFTTRVLSCHPWAMTTVTDIGGGSWSPQTNVFRLTAHDTSAPAFGAAPVWQGNSVMLYVKLSRKTYPSIFVEGSGIPLSQALSDAIDALVATGIDPKEALEILGNADADIVAFAEKHGDVTDKFLELVEQRNKAYTPVSDDELL